MRLSLIQQLSRGLFGLSCGCGSADFELQTRLSSLSILIFQITYAFKSASLVDSLWIQAPISPGSDALSRLDVAN